MIIQEETINRSLEHLDAIGRKKFPSSRLITSATLSPHFMTEYDKIIQSILRTQPITEEATKLWRLG